jgi:hypothetical protein
MDGRTHQLTINFSANRERIGVTEIGLRSLRERGRGIFDIGVSIAVRHWAGTMPLVIEQLKI